ncbi:MULTISPECIES: GNAT family N-acetyltransferase [unclassified Nonomuraea]|uniref:GNAT family N-acetyltransferase n=1 Tax=unclassified Nonomuraea TaxID=2593643 RepID=UPI0035BFC689
MSVEHTCVQIRPVREEDRHAVLELASQLAEGVAEWRDPGAVVEAARQWLAGFFAPTREQPGAVFVAMAEGEVVGMVSVNTHQHFTGPVEAYIGELAVAPRAVRTGVGRRLLSAAENWARQKGLRHLTLETAAGNTTARRFYAAVGYREEAIRFTRVLD